MNNKVLSLCKASIIAAIYTVLTLISAALGLSGGVIQLRLSEALCVLPYYTKTAIPGLFVGCILANFLTGSDILDVIFGSIATLLGALFSYLLRKYKWLVPIPPILSNIIIIPLLLTYVYHLEGTLLFFMLTVGIGEAISCYVFGMLLLFALKKRNVKKL